MRIIRVTSWMSSRLPSDPDLWILHFRHSLLMLSSLESISNPEEVKQLSIHADGNLLSEETRREAERWLRHQAEISVSHHIQDKHYIPRLIISAFVFLLLYFFFSLTVRDPLPMLDEIVLSFAGTALVWVLMSRNDIRIAMTSKLKMDLDTVIRNAEVVEEEILFHCEEYVDRLDSSIPELADILAHCSENTLPDFPYELPLKLKNAFEYHMAKEDHTLRDYYKLVRSCKGRDERLSARLIQAVTAEGLDLGLLALLIKAL